MGTKENIKSLLLELLLLEFFGLPFVKFKQKGELLEAYFTYHVIQGKVEKPTQGRYKLGCSIDVYPPRS